MREGRAGVRILIVVLVLLTVPLSVALGPSGPPTSSPKAPPSIVAPLSPMGPAYSHVGLTMELDLTVLHAAYPLTRLSVAGETVNGEAIMMLELGNFAVHDENTPALYVDGTVHGNEIPGGETIYWGARWMLEGYGWDERMTRLLDENRIVMLPLVNIDGNEVGRRTNANLVDLNRNFPWMWCQQPGASPIPGHPTYCGTGPASEPETQAMMQVIEDAQAQIVITMHSGIIELLYPWGYTSEPAPDHAMFQRMGDAFQAHTGFPHSNALYPVTGATRDWAYGTFGVPAFTYEVDFYQNNGQGMFQTPWSWEARLETAIDGMIWLLENARYMGAWVQVPEAAPAEGGTAIAFTFENLGWGDTTVHYEVEVVDAPLAEGTSGQRFVDAEADGIVTWVVETTGDGNGTIDLTMSFDRTKLHARPMTLEVSYILTVVDGLVAEVSLG